jgi:hypothetical protein
MQHSAALLLIASLAVGLSACAAPPSADGIGFRENRFREVQAVRDWQACRDEGLALEREAGRAAMPARHLAAARLLEGCDSGLGSDAVGLAPEERMRVMALAVLARLQGGDPAGARAGVERFRAGFAGRDLYFDDGTSFLDTLAALLDPAAPPGPEANVSGALEAELRRIARWRRG